MLDSDALLATYRTSVMAISGIQGNFVQAPERTVGHPVLHIRMPVSGPEQADTVTALQKRPASIHSVIANSTLTTDFVSQSSLYRNSHCRS
jgi:hypothetical protein